MWILAGTIALLVLLALLMKVMERRAFRDAPDDLPPVDFRRLGRNDPYGGGGDVGGGGW